MKEYLQLREPFDLVKFKIVRKSDEYNSSLFYFCGNYWMSMATFKTSKARENILGKIRKGLNEQSVPMPFPEVDKVSVSKAFADTELTIEEKFADNFIKLGGKFVFCENELEFMESIQLLYDNMGWQTLLCAEHELLNLMHANKLSFVQPATGSARYADACITGCETLVSRTGSVILSSKQNKGRTSPVFYPVHIIVAYAGQVVPDIQDSIDLMKKRYGNNLPSMINLNTGPSRTADIEKTLVVGVHGPGEVYCFFINK